MSIRLFGDLRKGLLRVALSPSLGEVANGVSCLQFKESLRFFPGTQRLQRITVDMSQFDVVFVLGGPGAGKGTQCAKIVEKYGFVHLSAGELLREEQKKEDSEFSNIIQHHMISGSIVPAYITCALLKNAMVNSKSSKRFLIDGFPRNQDNVDEWESRIAPLVNFRFVLFFDCDKDTCVKRCLQRGAQGSGRLDDNSTTLEKRFDTYLKSTKVIIDTYDSSRQVQQVDASKDIESIFSQVQIIMDDAFLHHKS